MNESFASVAEAVAYFAEQGFKTTSQPPLDARCRFMQCGRRGVRIERPGMLDVRVTLFEADGNSWVVTS